MPAERTLGLSPSKVIAVHLNYPSRAAERGRTPSVPSYFLKPPSSISGTGEPVVRPRGVELLAYEGELAIVLSKPARRVSIEEARACVGWYAAANDFGVYDLRWADRGSNLLAKGHDSFTPIGPKLVPADELDLAEVSLCTRVNGEVVQEGRVADLIFPPEQLIADLSRFMTLEPGDIILTGTPANSRPVEPGDVVEVEVDGIGVLSNPIVEDDRDLEPLGAMPKVSEQTRAAALGSSAPTPAGVLTDEVKAALRQVSTATLTVQLRKHGIRNTFLAGLKPTRPDMRMVGYAHTLRYVPLREDVLAADKAELNAQKRTIESLEEDEVLVIEARGEAGAGTIGDILAMRAMRRGAAGIVTDGGVRDTPAVSGLDIPTYFQAPHAAVLGLIHYPLDDNIPIACAGVLVMPGDVIVGDAEGAIVIPPHLAETVAFGALEQEEREEWALERVDEGESIRGVYPISKEREADFEAWRARRNATPSREEADEVPH